jgi:hypothetical protein
MQKQAPKVGLSRNVYLIVRQGIKHRKEKIMLALIFGIPTAIIAGIKGFKPLRWLFSFGPLGLIVVLCLSSAKAKDITSRESELRAAKANTVGAWMFRINIGLGVIYILFLLSPLSR